METLIVSNSSSAMLPFLKAVANHSHMCECFHEAAILMPDILMLNVNILICLNRLKVSDSHSRKKRFRINKVICYICFLPSEFPCAVQIRLHFENIIFQLCYRMFLSYLSCDTCVAIPSNRANVFFLKAQEIIHFIRSLKQTHSPPRASLTQTNMAVLPQKISPQYQRHCICTPGLENCNIGP